MSSVLGHALAGTVVASAGFPRGASRARAGAVALAVAAALTPDLDVVWMALRPGAGDVHRGVTHGLPFAIVVAGVLAAVSHRPLRQPAARLFLVFLAAVTSHLVLDYLMGAGAPIRPLTPFEDRGFSAPLTLVPVAYYARTPAAYARPTFWLLNARAALIEALIVAPWLVVVARGQRTRTRLLAAGTAIAAMLLTAALYR